jgi:pimeloyl-ACP methyl ester carboxylesterase
MLGTGTSAQDHAPLDRWLAALRQRPEVVPSIWELDAPVSPALRQRLLSNDLEALIAQRIQRKEPLGFDDMLPSLPIPCLLMVGEADAAYARVQACSRMIRNITFVSFPSLGHTVSFLNRAEVVLHMQQFLRGLAGGWDENAVGTSGPAGNTLAQRPVSQVLPHITQKNHNGYRR